MSEPTIYRDPGEDTEDYPGLHVQDQTVTGSIRCGGRLPLWAFTSTAIFQGWDRVEEGWSPTEHYGFTERDLACFLTNLLEQRGEMARLLLTLADVERETRDVDDLTGDYVPWWRREDLRSRVVAQLRACLDLLDGEATR